jgi:hypothetical protein
MEVTLLDEGLCTNFPAPIKLTRRTHWFLFFLQSVFMPLKPGLLFIKRFRQKAFYYLPWHGIESTLLNISFNADAAEVQSRELMVPGPVL